MGTAMVAGNWKMNTTPQQAAALVAEMRPHLDAVSDVLKVVCPPFVSLAPVAEALRGSTVSLGAQNMHHEESGAYTGEVSGAMLSGLCQYVILGHSERRQHFGETDDSVNLKLRAALRQGLMPILCVGEGLAEREEGRAEQVVDAQLRAGLDGVDGVSGLVVAYEPIWAIGTGRAATPDAAQAVMGSIRKTLEDLYGREDAAGVSLLYGGSVDPANAADFAQQPDVDGALVGGASLEAASFVAIAQAVSSAGDPSPQA